MSRSKPLALQMPLEKARGVPGLLWRRWLLELSPGQCDATPPLSSPGDALFREGLELEAQWLLLDEA